MSRTDTLETVPSPNQFEEDWEEVSGGVPASEIKVGDMYIQTAGGDKGFIINNIDKSPALRGVWVVEGFDKGGAFIRQNIGVGIEKPTDSKFRIKRKTK